MEDVPAIDTLPQTLRELITTFRIDELIEKELKLLYDYDFVHLNEVALAVKSAISSETLAQRNIFESSNTFIVMCDKLLQSWSTKNGVLQPLQMHKYYKEFSSCKTFPT